MERIGVGQHHHLAALFRGEMQVVVGVELAHRLRVDAQAVFKQLDKTLRQLAAGHAVQIPDKVLVLRLAQIDFLMLHAAHSVLLHAELS